MGDQLILNRGGVGMKRHEEGPLGARVQEGEGGNSEALVVGWEGQLCPIQGYQSGPVAVTVEKTPGKEGRRPQRDRGGRWGEPRLPLTRRTGGATEAAGGGWRRGRPGSGAAAGPDWGLSSAGARPPPGQARAAASRGGSPPPRSRSRKSHLRGEGLVSLGGLCGGTQGRKRRPRDPVPLAIRSWSRRGPDWVMGAGEGGRKMDARSGRKSPALKTQRM